MRKVLLPVALVVSLAPFAASAASPPQAATTPPPLPTDVAAKLDGQPITVADLDRAAASDLYEVRQKVLERLLNERVIAPAAKQAGLSVEDFLQKRVTERVPPVSEAEARQFLEENRARMPEEMRDKPWDEIKPVMIQGVTAMKRKEAVGAVIDELRAQAKAEVLLAPPRFDVAAVGPAKGDAKAKVTIVEFSDFQCPYCGRGRKVVDQVLKAYPGKVRVVFRDYPLSFHDHAEKAAEAGRCADEQKKFWPLHDWMFDHQDALAESDVEAAAKKLGLDGKRFHDCVASGKYAKAVAASLDAGSAVGVHGTPAFFINGVFLNGALPFEEFKREIDRALK